MRYSDKIKHLTPADMAVGAIPFKVAGEVVDVIDIYPMHVKDIFWLLNKAPNVVAAWGAPKEERILAIIKAVSTAGEEVLQFLTARALDTTVEELNDPTKPPMALELQVDVLTAFFDLGVPPDFFDKLAGGVDQLTGGRMTAYLDQAMSMLSSAATSRMSSATSLTEDTTPTP